MEFYKTTITEETCNAIRSKFLEKYKDNIEKGVYEQEDLDRLNKDDKWIRAFYKNGLENEAKTVDAIHDTLQWRKQFDAKGLLLEENFNFDKGLLNSGFLFFKNKDNRGRPTLNIVSAKHKKGTYPPTQVYRYIAYFFEKNYSFSLEQPMVLMYDMTGAGLANVDLDLSRFTIACLQTYYPGLNEYVVVYDLPFILNAAWTIIKNILPAKGVELVKFVNKKTIRDYYAEDQIFVHLGGSVKYVYAYEPSIYLGSSQ